MLKLLPLTHPPIAIGFLDTPPPGIEKWHGGPVPAGCCFWRYAMEGRAFYTEPAAHLNCAVGAHTHAIAQPANRSSVLEDAVGLMVGNGYIEMAEIPDIPVLRRSPRYIAYAPAEGATFAADLVLLAAKPYAAMLLYEAAVAAGVVKGASSVLGRPACAVLPLTQNSNSTSLSFGCKGNRTFTGLADEEMYVCVPAGQWVAVTRQLERIHAANGAMEAYYREHQRKFPILN